MSLYFQRILEWIFRLRPSAPALSFSGLVDRRRSEVFVANDPWRVRANLTSRDGPGADQPANRGPAQLQGRGCFVERGLSAFRPFTFPIGRDLFLVTE